MTTACKIFVVDDDEVSSLVLEKQCERSLCAVEISKFRHGLLAIVYLIEHQNQPSELPDCIFLDMDMPIMNGWEFLEQYQRILPSLQKNIRIYMMSAFVNDRDYLRGLQTASLTDIIEKPIPPEKILEIVSTRLTS